ncbi:MAG: hypothetical protein CMN85_10870 [Spongiibacteraceae bacterium]|uniref:head-tail connector protein n=1 Tax=uncultured Haliea sp. TaxID=622616 RepID=UPI000C514A74|nr:hypothetical protein [Spongiibacteraceae bacterium]|tara:strand:+ start:22639 stop:23226 length:588 start_codon:yes stop_codon:yes gene_type:complete
MRLDGWSLSTVEAPAEEPVTTAEAKDHARIDISDDDTLVDAMVESVRLHTEDFLGRALVTQTLSLQLDRFPEVIELPRPPLQSVSSITYVDADGATQTLAASKYRVDNKSAPARVTPAWGEVWPSTRAVTGAVTVQFVAGYGAAADVPQRIKHAILMAFGHLYENREDVSVGVQGHKLPQNSQWLLWPLRVKWFQ